MKEYEATTPAFKKRKLQTYEKGDVIFEEGGMPKGIYFIESGTVKLIYNRWGTQPGLVRLGMPKEFLGVQALVSNSRYSTTAEIAKTASIWFLPKENFINVMQNNTDFAVNFTVALSYRVKKAEEQIYLLKTKDAKQRLANALIEINSTKDKKSGNLIELTKKDMAALISVSPETLSRHLAEFKEKKIIHFHQNGIEIKQAEKLRVISGKYE